MKKVMMTMLMTVLTPTIGEYVISNGVCKAGEVVHIRPDNWPDVLPVYSSYYNGEEEKLYIYGTEKNTLVKVMYEGQIVLFDTILSGNLPAVYDFSKGESGMYQVIVFDESTILTSFEFYKD